MPRPVLDNGESSPQSIHVVNKSPSGNAAAAHKAGTRGRLQDGRVFYYVHNETTSILPKGRVIVTATVTPNHHDQTVNAASDFTIHSKNVVFNPGATAINLDEYVDGYAFISDSTGQGITYQIESHVPNAGSGAQQSSAILYEPVAVGAGAVSTISLVRNPYKNPQVSNTTVSEIPIGIPQISIPAATTASTTVAHVVDGYYGWVQTWGPSAVLCDEAIAAEGVSVTIGTGTAGAAEACDTADGASQEFILGYNYTPFVDGEFQLVDLRIRP